MAGRDKESQEIMSAAMQSVKNGGSEKLKLYTLSALKKADKQLGKADIGSGYRKEIQERITELENRSALNSQSIVRAIGYLVALAIALIAVFVGVSLS